MAKVRNQTKESINFKDVIGDGHEEETVEFSLKRGYRVVITRSEYDLEVTVYDEEMKDEKNKNSEEDD